MADETTQQLTTARAAVEEWSVAVDGWTEVFGPEEAAEKLGSFAVDTLVWRVAPGIVKQSENAPDIACVRATCEVGAPAQAVFDAYWKQEAKWNRSTVSSLQVLEDGNTQIVYEQHKTLSAATPRRDLLLARQSETDSQTGAIRVWGCSCTSPKMPKQKDFVRAVMYYTGLCVTPLSPTSCKATLLSCFDFTGWIHVKFYEVEKATVGQRLGRIKELALASVGITTSKAPTPTPKPISQFIHTTSSDTYRAYLQAVKEAKDDDDDDTTEQDKPSVVYRAPAAQPQPEPLLPAAGSETVLACGKCKTPGTGRFCSTCGTRLAQCCAACFFAEPTGRFCSGCGARLTPQ
eukprot:TRINITY_DN9650_c0_g1_i1.p1 TRINITY_DN9650_c0_g1~~TRINITY_DN9650_c0_g1_i1.p1  ORF type:complete len:347 (-),score=82.67 TRINITY_DN9650_c0_g1_i1:50-1090(-)